MDYTPAELAVFRIEQNDKLTRLAQRGKSWDERMKGHINSPDTVKELNRNINVVLVAVLIDTLDYPDKDLPLQLFQGLPICGNIAYDSDVYRKVSQKRMKKTSNSSSNGHTLTKYVFENAPKNAKPRRRHGTNVAVMPENSTPSRKSAERPK